MKHYRQVWIEAFGPIPKDKDGRSHEIHHLNKDGKDNRLENLVCLTIQEHLDIHIAQGDQAAAMMIARRMGKTPEELSAIQLGNKHSAATRLKIKIARNENKKSAWNKGKTGYKLRGSRSGSRYSSKITAADVIFMRQFLLNKINVTYRRKDSSYINGLAWWLQENHYPQLTVVGICNILVGKSWKEVQFNKNTEYEILTPAGFKDFSGIRTHQTRGMFKVTLESGKILRCTPDHQIQTSTGFKQVKTLTYSDKIMTSCGYDEIKYLDKEISSEVVYDPVEVVDGHEYYSDDIVSHNCEFISSDAMLIDSIKLSYFKASVPVSENMGFRFWSNDIGGKNKTYLVGVDPATGNGNDFTVIEVIEFPSLEQVAELRLNSVSIPLIYSKIKWLLKHLRQPDAGRGRAEVIWSFERNGVGEALVAMIQNDDSVDGGIYLDGTELYNESANRLGCYTTGKSKLISCMQLKNLLEKIAGGLKIHSDILLFELQNFVAAGGTYQARAGSTDDTVMAMAVVMKVLNRLSSYDDKARQIVYETVAPDSDQSPPPDFDQYGSEPVPFF